MVMISYAQNREDVLLHRAFPQSTGFYIDIGAADPVGHSVTKWFYDAGWSGVNVEPLPQFFDRLVRQRPRDVNLNVAVSERAGEIRFHEVPSSPGMSTMDAAVTRRFESEGLEIIPHVAKAVTLAEICEEYVEGPIDFLKIDVEGAEEQVLAGADFKRWRPRVIVIEATDVGRSTPNHHAWEHLVLRADYHFATFDGLNRYYTRGGDGNLKALLQTPVNVFDDYIPAELLQEQAKRLDLELRCTNLQDELVRITGELSIALGRLTVRNTELALLGGTLEEKNAIIDSQKTLLSDHEVQRRVFQALLCQTREHLDSCRSLMLADASIPHINRPLR